MTAPLAIRRRAIPAGFGLIAAALAIVLMVLASVPARAQDDTAEILALLERWAATYSSPDATPEAMLELYDPDSVFWGTGARTPFVGAAEIGPYFGQQFANFPVRKVSFVESIVRVYGDAATVTGLYRFEVQTRSGQQADVTHRYSYALARGETGWRLVHQHSSAMPPQ